MRRKRHHDEDTSLDQNGVRESSLEGCDEDIEVDEVMGLDDAIAKIDSLEKELAEKTDDYLRAVAEQRNIRRRSDEHRLEQVQFANREFALALLPTVDDFERALAAAEKNQSFESLIEGVNMTYRKLQIGLQKAGVVAIEAEGKPFDPNYHDAVMMEQSDEVPDNSVIAELQCGYTMNGKVLRPTMVKVAQNG